MWASVLNLLESAPGRLLVAAMSPVGMLMAVARRGKSGGWRAALDVLFLVGTLAFVFLISVRAVMGVTRIYADECDRTARACRLYGKCRTMPQELLDKDAHRVACLEERETCENQPAWRTLDRLTDVFPTWDELKADLQTKLLLVCVLGLLVQIGNSLVGSLCARSADYIDHAQHTKVEAVVRATLASALGGARGKGVRLSVHDNHATPAACDSE